MTWTREDKYFVFGIVYGLTLGFFLAMGIFL